MNAFSLSILSAERRFYNGKCVSIIVPTSQGQYGIQAKHCNMIAAVVPGMLKYTTPDGEIVIAAISEGIVKVEDNQVVLLVDTIERPDEINEKRAIDSEKAAKDILSHRNNGQEYRFAQMKLARAISRVKVKHYNDSKND